jgi:PAS domain S-box-containing protein
MNKQAKTKQELIEENALLKHSIYSLEKSEADSNWTEWTIKESNERFLSLTKNIPWYIACINADTLRYEFVNDAFAKAFGISREKIIGSHLKDILGDDNYQFVLKYVAEVSLGKSVSYEDTFNLAAEKRWIQVNYTPVIDTNGHVSSISVFGYDITERKLMEEKSKNLLNFLQTLINTIPSPIFCKDIHGCYQDCNKEFEDYTGFKKEDIIGKGVYDMFPKDVADKYHEMDLALFSQPGRQIYEHPILYADGKKHDVVVNKATYLNADGTLAGLVGVMVDITERKRAEEELKIYHEYLEKVVQERTTELESKTKTLEEVNIALKVLLKHQEEDRQELEDRFVMNIKQLIIPFVEKMRNTGLDQRQIAYMSIMETYLNDISSKIIKRMHQFNFTPTEVEVATLIKEGRSTKDIAMVIGIAPSSVNTHRGNIRKKLDITNKKVNLRSHLQSFNQ